MTPGVGENALANSIKSILGWIPAYPTIIPISGHGDRKYYRVHGV